MTASLPVRPISAEEYPALTAVAGRGVPGAMASPRPQQLERGGHRIRPDDRRFRRRATSSAPRPLLVRPHRAGRRARAQPGSPWSAVRPAAPAAGHPYRDDAASSSATHSTAASRSPSCSRPSQAFTAVWLRPGFLAPAAADSRAGTARSDRGRTAPALPAPGCGPSSQRKAGQARPPVYAAAGPTRPGMLARDDRWWHSCSTIRPPARRHVAAALPARRGRRLAPRLCALPDQALWKDGIAAGTLRLRELVATDPAAIASLWSDLLDRDLVGEVIAPIRPIDDPLLALLADPRRAHGQRVSDAVWVRLI